MLKCTKENIRRNNLVIIYESDGETSQKSLRLHFVLEMRNIF